MRSGIPAVAIGLLALPLLLASDRPVRGAASARWPDLSELPARQGGGKKDAAVVIGISEYAEVPDVPGAAQNAVEWVAWLVRGRRVPFAHVKLLRDREATDVALRAAARTAARQVEPGGTLWFIFIGHGAPTRDGQDGVLVGYDARQQADALYARSVPRAEIVRTLSKGRQARTVLVLDACFSGQASGSGEALVEDMPVIPVALPTVDTPNVIALTAGGPNEFAGPLPGVGRPAFSYLLLGALRGWADRDSDVGNRDGAVTAREAIDYVTGAIGAAMKGRSQTPSMQGSASEMTLAVRASEDGPDLLSLLLAAAPAPPSQPRAPVSHERTEELGRIAPEEGMLRVEGTPPGAAVVITGPDVFGARGSLEARLPWGPTKVPAGEYTVRTTAPGYEPVDRTVRIFADRTEVVRVALESAVGTLEITGKPHGAKVELRCAKGFTRVFGLPGTLTVPRGECTLRVTRDGYDPINQTVHVAGGERTDVPVELVSLTDHHARRGRSSTGRAGIEWIRLQGGSFQMGSTTGEDDEKPVHTVRLSSFDMAKTEVTVAQYHECVTAGACTKPHWDDSTCWIRQDNKWIQGKAPLGIRQKDHPVVCVDWSQAVAFSRWAGGRLPTEAEWEFAARSGGLDSLYPWGDATATCALAVMGGGRGRGCGRGESWPVCSKPHGNSAQGLCDLAGNVWEWTQDWYHSDYRGAPSDGSAWEAPAGSKRVGRGGWWGGSAVVVRASERSRSSPAHGSFIVGFRPVKDVAP